MTFDEIMHRLWRALPLFLAAAIAAGFALERFLSAVGA